jgi:hypothetical protein
MPASVQRSLIQLQLMWVRSLDCGLAGKGVAEKIDPTVEDAYWRENYTTRPYYKKGATYETYQPAYRTGYEGRTRYTGRSFEEAETDLRSGYAIAALAV